MFIRILADPKSGILGDSAVFKNHLVQLRYSWLKKGLPRSSSIEDWSREDSSMETSSKERVMSVKGEDVFLLGMIE